MAFCVKKFLSYLCLVDSTDPELIDLDFAALGIPEDLEDVLRVICKLKALHNLEIQSIVDKTLSSTEFTSPEFCTRAILRICVKLSMNPIQWNFMLICTLISCIIIEYFYVLECFTFAYIGLQCLSEVYERCYKDLFNVGHEYETLAFHCKNLNPDLLYEEHPENSWPIYDKGSISSLIESLQDINDVNFEFTDSEKVLLDTLAASNQIEQTFEVETSNSSESSLTDEDSSEETLDRLNMPVSCSSLKNRVCTVCGKKCFGVVLWFQHELVIRESHS